MTSRDLSRLFELDGDIPYLSKEARNIKCFLTIINRDKGKQKLISGVNKLIKETARKEIAFIYFYVNREEYANYEDSERIAIIKKRLGIDFELDDEVWKAVNELKQDAVTREEKLIENYYDTLDNYTILLKELNAKTKKVITLLNVDDAKLKPEERIERDTLLENCRSDFKWCMDASNQLKVTFKNLEELNIAKAAKSRKIKVNRLETDRKLYERHV